MAKSRVSLKYINELEAKAEAVTGSMRPAVFGLVDMDRNIVKKFYYGLKPAPEDAECDALISLRLQNILSTKYAVIILKGGRGSGKTKAFSKVMTELIRYEGKRCVALRETLNSIQDSVYQEIVDECDSRHIVGKHMTILHNKIKSAISAGALIFRGMKSNITGIKGLAGHDIAWMEEIEDVSQISLDTLKPTIFRNDAVELPQIWGSFNPRNDDDPSYTDLIEPYESRMIDGVYDSFTDPTYDPEKHVPTLIIEMNHNHNPWFGNLMRMEMATMKERDYDRYLWIWEGKFYNNSHEVVLHGKCEIESFDLNPNWTRRIGADFGFSQDPSTLIDCYHDESQDILYIYDEAYGAGVELYDLGMFYAGKAGCLPDQVMAYDLEYADKYPGIDGVEFERIWCDESRPDTISMLRKKHGLNTKGAPKGPGSIEDGVTWLRGRRKIVIHPRCKNVIFETKNYKYKIDPKTERITSAIVDDHNHTIDAIRYAMNYEIRAASGLFN